MSSEAAYRLADTISGTRLVPESEVPMVTRHSAGDVKKALENVHVAWLRRVGIISPSVEEGVDFNREWFDCTFIYMCPFSTTPRGLDQMKGHVRYVREPTVLCFVHSRMVLSTVSTGCFSDVDEASDVEEELYSTGMAPKRAAFSWLGVEETYQFFRRVDGKLDNIVAGKTRHRGDAGEPEYIPVEFAAGRIRQREEGGVSEVVPAEDAVIRMFAHNEAEQGRYFALGT
ncbi:hypothetical protein KFL_005960055 [Klebsormidium nitens]|uniref:Uncharacterized protein n=1 Tax=Klebsormidium nitens TaxID=105231 RepID=A0A1Y1IMT9_KLENI|nr:hypothetical protein KFL_005960055 [Klebsormidium nitens]|eukprot:GAQ90076.1 hypothetical protein KFL_005960055 [Klebsormidium nitens]